MLKLKVQFNKFGIFFKTRTLHNIGMEKDNGEGRSFRRASHASRYAFYKIAGF